MFNSLHSSKVLAASLLHRITSFRHEFFILMAMTLLVLILSVEKPVNIFISNSFSSFFFGLIDKKGEKSKILYFFTIIIYVHVFFIQNTNLLFNINCYLVYIFFCMIPCVFKIQSGFVIFPKRGRLLSCILCFSLFLFLCFGMILKLSMNLFFPHLFLTRNGIPELPSAVA